MCKDTLGSIDASHTVERVGRAGSAKIVFER